MYINISAIPKHFQLYNTIVLTHEYTSHSGGNGYSADLALPNHLDTHGPCFVSDCQATRITEGMRPEFPARDNGVFICLFVFVSVCLLPLFFFFFFVVAFFMLRSERQNPNKTAKQAALYYARLCLSKTGDIVLFQGWWLVRCGNDAVKEVTLGSNLGREWVKYGPRFCFSNEHVYKHVDACLAFVCTARTMIVAHVKYPLTNFRYENA